VTLPPFKVGDYVRVVATGAIGVVVELSRRHATADVDLGDGITAELAWDELEPVTPRAPAS
jgi:hypothetical protein